MQDINISTIIGSTVPVEEQLKLIKNAGFDGFFLTYTGIEPLVSWAETAYQLGLKFETIHGPFLRQTVFGRLAILAKIILHI